MKSLRQRNLEAIAQQTSTGAFHPAPTHIVTSGHNQMSDLNQSIGVTRTQLNGYLAGLSEKHNFEAFGKVGFVTKDHFAQRLLRDRKSMFNKTYVSAFFQNLFEHHRNEFMFTLQCGLSTDRIHIRKGINTIALEAVGTPDNMIVNVVTIFKGHAQKAGMTYTIMEIK